MTALCSVLLDSLRSHGLQSARLLCLRDLLGENTGVGCHFLLQGIFLTQGSKLHLLHPLHWQLDSLLLHHLGSQGYVYHKVKQSEDCGIRLKKGTGKRAL